MRPINSIKHIVDKQGGTVIATKADNILVVARDQPNTLVAEDVQVGGRVNSMFLNVTAVAQSDEALSNIYFIIYKNPGDNIVAGSIPDANKSGTSDFRKQIFHTEMAMMSDAGDSIPITLFKGVLKIPQRYQRMGINDQIVLQIFTPGTSCNFCIQCIYKEYR